MNGFKAVVGMLVLAGLAACGGDVVGSRFVKSQPVPASSAAVISVTDADSTELAGTRLEIPSGALASATTITLEIGLKDLVPSTYKAGRVALWGPAGLKFSAPVKMTLPFSAVTGKSLSDTANALSVVVVEKDGSAFRIPRSALTVDAAASRVSFNVSGFTSFQPTTQPACTGNQDCASGDVCVNAVCQNPRNIDGGPGVCATNNDCATGQVCVNGACSAGGTGGGMGGTGGGMGGTGGGMGGTGGGMGGTGGGMGGTGGGMGGGNGGGGGGGGTCMTNNDCAAGSVCMNGVCIPRGTGGGAGGGGNGGGAGGGNPVDGGVCVTANDCGANEICDNGVCTTDLDGGIDGGSGGGSGQDAGLCITSNDCGAGLVCVNGACEGTPVDGGQGNFCRTDLECALGQVCINMACTVDLDAGAPDAGNASDGGTAVDGGAPVRCMSNLDCPVSQACFANICQ